MPPLQYIKRKKERERESAKMERHWSSKELHNLIEAIKSSDVSFSQLSLTTISTSILVSTPFNFTGRRESCCAAYTIEGFQFLWELRPHLSHPISNCILQSSNCNFTSRVYCGFFSICSLNEEFLDVLGRFHVFGCIAVLVEQKCTASGCQIRGFRLVWLFVAVSSTWNKGTVVSLRFLCCVVLMFLSLCVCACVLGECVVWKAFEDDSYVERGVPRGRTLRPLFPGIVRCFTVLETHQTVKFLIHSSRTFDFNDN